MCCKILTIIATKCSLNVRWYLIVKHPKLILIVIHDYIFLPYQKLWSCNLSFFYPELIMILYSVGTSFMQLLRLLGDLVPVANKFFDNFYQLFAITVSDRYLYLPFANVDYWEVKVRGFLWNYKFLYVGIFDGFHVNKLI